MGAMFSLPLFPGALICKPVPLPTPCCSRAEKSSSSQGLENFWTEQPRLTCVLGESLYKMTTLPSKCVALSMHSKVGHLQACPASNAITSVSGAALYPYLSSQHDFCKCFLYLYKWTARLLRREIGSSFNTKC